ncbi:MAG: amidohydrolase family protein [Candidatus Bathyarchaeia archaeon]
MERKVIFLERICSKPRIIDCHTHIGNFMGINNPMSPWDKVTLETLISFLDGTNASKAVVLSVYSWNNAALIMPTPYVLEACRKYPSRLIPFASLDVREPFFEEEIRLYLEMGCQGFGEYTCKVPVKHRINLKLFEICAKFEIPVLIHLATSENDPYGALDPDLSGLEKMAKKFSDVNFIMHGPGWWRHISAEIPQGVGYPQGMIKEPGRAVSLLENYPNIFGDLSAFSGYNAIHRDLDFGKNFLEKLNRKLLYGTDLEAFFSPQHSLIDLFKNINIKLSSEIYDNILYKNLEELLPSS